MCSYTVNFPPRLIHRAPRELFTADLVMAQRCSNNYINNFHFRTHKHIHTFTYICLETRANTQHSTQCGGAHTKGLGKELFIFSPLFATFALAVGLSACLGVTKRKEGRGRNKKKRRGPSFPFCSAKQIRPLPLAHFDIRWIQRFILGILSRREILTAAEWSLKVQHFVFPSPHATRHSVLYAKHFLNSTFITSLPPSSPDLSLCQQPQTEPRASQ